VETASVTGNHTYTATGVYTLVLTVTGSDGESDQAIFQFVVDYDPDGGFVTGAGQIDSPSNAYTADPQLTGRAHFGFTSKYKKGAATPTGHTDFRFQVAGLKFRGTEYQWLVVAGVKAQFKGTGTINGTGEFKFMLTAIDGDITGGGGLDKFRIKIWSEDVNDYETVEYDNQLEDAEDADPTTVISKGSIVIHK
jgi:PKD repeat protein